MPRRTSCSATSCGVVTMTPPVTGTSWSERQLRVAGAGRKVDDQDVELAPDDVLQELAHDAHDHRPAPDDRRAIVEEEPHRDDRDPEALDRHDLLLLEHARAGLGRAGHEWHARAVHVGVEQARPADRGPLSASARLTATVDLPTPPLPLATATMCCDARERVRGCRQVAPVVDRSASAAESDLDAGARPASGATAAAISARSVARTSLFCVGSVEHRSLTVAVADRDVTHEPKRHDVAGETRIADAGQTARERRRS